MPFKSEKQRKFLWRNHPEIAKRWAEEFPNQKDLPTYKEKEASPTAKKFIQLAMQKTKKS